ncbi:FecR domain-containing protein [Bacteroides fragilis]|uniref:FecR family protein n=1 Tax=Bacteroides TaxID=816 RepID=UPI001896E7ED|nr:MULTISPECIES: FecR domain-containing protein [Bacteroides]MCE8625750.1 FecR domain-containing protein [Bacteroides fragilis]MCE8700679.1 FecR domain-containing protein [Bacteroides fragilis]MCE8706503.1 FecR domain-containing protein [Bacteroides fragilis]MCE9324105.1 FecR domain-containing protein [Bacteroides fragilis]MCE9446246.1 FecR domain-containing protein [Bacteroides fragilis]
MDETKLLNYLKGESDAEECLEVETWYHDSAEHKKQLEQLYYMLFVGERKAVMDAVDTESSLSALKDRMKQKEPDRKSVGKMRVSKWKRYAVPLAAFLCGLLISTGALYWMSSGKSAGYVFATEAGQRARAVLPDGTKVWLNASTQLVYKPSFWKRERLVDLNGEAYFEVSHNKHRPFVVNSKDVRTCVLGTKFNVRARSSEAKVVTTLLKGLVQVQLPGQSEEEGILLKPGQTLSVDTRTMQLMLTEADRPGDVLLWINGKLKFEQATLVEIVQCLEKHFDVHFIISDAQLKKERFTCTFSTDDDIRQILSILALTKRFDYKCEDNNIILTPKAGR